MSFHQHRVLSFVRPLVLGTALAWAGPAVAAPAPTDSLPKPWVLFDGHATDALAPNAMWQQEGTLLAVKANGRIQPRHPVANVELRLDYRFTEKPGEIRLDRGTLVHPQENKATGRWHTVHATLRTMPGEKSTLKILHPVASKHLQTTQMFGSGKHLNEANQPTEDGYPRDARGFVVGAPPPLQLWFRVPTEIRRLELRPLNPDSPREYLDRTAEELTQDIAAGQAIYAGHCVNCHGDGIGTPPLATARSFVRDGFRNGGDPYSLWKTLTYGYETMPPVDQHSDLERYQVIAYLRETIIKPNAPEHHVAIDDAYLDRFGYPLYSSREIHERDNKPGDLWERENGLERDFGNALTTTGGPQFRNTLNVKLPHGVTIGYNLNDLATARVWHDGFFWLLDSQHYLGRPSAMPRPVGTPLDSLAAWRWGHGGRFDYPQADTGDRGPIPDPGFRYHGYYTHGTETIVSYRVGHRDILEFPDARQKGDGPLVLEQTLAIQPGDAPLLLQLGRAGSLPEGPLTDDLVLVAGEGPNHVAGYRLACEEDAVTWAIREGRLVVEIPGGEDGAYFVVARALGSEKQIRGALEAIDLSEKVWMDLGALTEGGPELWEEDYTVTGRLSEDEVSAYVMDTLPLPEENAYNTWFRTTALAFFDDGRAAVATHGGDVWIVSGIDDGLQQVTWSRFAAGLFEVFGLQVVDGLIYATTRNGIVRLHDRNQDGEADFYEQFFVDPEVSSEWHGYNFDLVRDDEGFFYYSKAGQFTDITFDGGCYRIAPDGRSSELIATGFRVPNGMGRLPDGRVLYGENQGGWIPAGKVSIIERGAFYGSAKRYKEKHHKAPETFEQPVMWFPQDVDNSCGGQVWAGDPRFGPLSGNLVHLSCGKAQAMMLFLDEAGEGTPQGAVSRFPFTFDSGVMRARVNPRDGQVYLVGTRGWQIAGHKDGCLQRIRYTGRPGLLLLDARARAGSLELTFSEPLDPQALDPQAFAFTLWNYRYSERYGSPKYSVRNPGQEGVDTLPVESLAVSPDGKTLHVRIPDLVPAHQYRLDYRVNSTGGHSLASDVHFTVHRLPEPGS